MRTNIGAVSYLNTKPLIYGLEKRLPDANLLFDLPSRLADRLAARELDIALIPSAEFLRSSDLQIVSDACIACQGPVRSVQLLFRTQPSEVQTVALDEGSRTSALLAQVLLQRLYGIHPEVRDLPIDADFHAQKTDAVLVIGDRAMQIDDQAYVDAWDLGAKWFDLTGLPFVFAMWVTQHSEIGAEMTQALQQSRDAGVLHADRLAQQFAQQYGLQPRDCLDYFQKQLYFYLGDRQLAGLELFRGWATELNLLPESSQRLSLQPL